MSNLFKTFKTDSDKETKGIDVTFEANDDGSIPTFKIARQGGANKQYALELERESKPYQRQIALDTLSKSTSESIVLRVFVRTILLGWENLQDKNNQPIEYNEENAIRVLTELPDLYNELWATSTKMALYREDVLDATVKN